MYQHGQLPWCSQLLYDILLTSCLSFTHEGLCSQARHYNYFQCSVGLSKLNLLTNILHVKNYDF